MEYKILLTGGSGLLGTELQKYFDCYAPSVKELDVTDLKSCKRAIKKYSPDIVIHCAGYTDVARAEKDKERCWNINTNGTENMVRASNGVRFIYISTDYVFDGEKGNYKEEDVPNPVNFYALTKLAGELIVKQYPHTLIIRTAFKKNGPWKYDNAFIDQFSSHMFVSEVAQQIAEACLMSDLEGVIHIAGERKSIYDLAKKVSPEVGKISIKEVQTHIPRDVSLNISKWKKLSKLSKLKKQKK